jgi:hypothetical protein
MEIRRVERRAAGLGRLEKEFQSQNRLKKHVISLVPCGILITLKLVKVK